MTIGTAALTVEATWQELDALIAFLASLDLHEVAISFGWGCNAAGIEQPVIVPLAALVDFLQNSIAQAIYHLGEDNLYMEASAPSLRITLCHDADIHFEATDASLEARLRAEWEGRSIHVWPTSPKA